MAWTVIQHGPFEGPGLITMEARARGVELDLRHPDRGDPIPDLAEIDGLVVMGGPTGGPRTQTARARVPAPRDRAARGGRGRLTLFRCSGSASGHSCSRARSARPGAVRLAGNGAYANQAFRFGELERGAA